MVPSPAEEQVDHAWPENATERYERIRPLGKGSFGIVWMAKVKDSEPITSTSTHSSRITPTYVAIKHIKTSNSSERRFAKREIEILQELMHPNIIRLIEAFDEADVSRSRLVVMELASGPDLKKLLNAGGALGIPLSRLIARELIAAVSYLHGHAVLHRDIKPENCILVVNEVDPTIKTWHNGEYDDAFWSDGEDVQDAINANRWKIVLVDFGFARALSPSGLRAPPANGSMRRKSILTESLVTRESLFKTLKETEGGIELKEARTSLNRSLKGITNNSKVVSEQFTSNKISSQHSRKSLRHSVTQARQSISHVRCRAMSALGSAAYAAPEIKNNFRQKSRDCLDVENVALTKCVADYGMVVDAYSVGATLREIMTGVPPNENVQEYISKHDQFISHVFSYLSACRSKKQTRRKKFRYVNELPKDSVNLVSLLTKMDGKERLTVREAQLHPWICADGYVLPEGDFPSKHGDPVVFLKCTS